MNIECIHSSLLNILKYIDYVCKENNITYFLSGGSALGAIRHKGFIPWDDDADIMMARKDYLRFIEVMSKQKNNCYQVGSVYNVKNWSLAQTRIWDTSTEIVCENLEEAAMGIFVDVFPLDGLPKSIDKTKHFYKKIKIFHVLRNSSIRKRLKEDEKYHIVKKIMGPIAKIIGVYRIAKYIDRIAQKRAYDESEYVGVAILYHYMEKEHFKRSAFQNVIYLPFEDIELPVPVGYDHYLSSLYGDYMKLPPENQRNSNHHMRILLK